MTRHNPNCSHEAPVGCTGASTDAPALDLAPRLYAELRALARGWMRHEAPHHTLSATELAHEAYFRLNDQDETWSSRTHFLSVAAIIIRRILVDHARARGAVKRGGGWRRIELSDASLWDRAGAAPVFDVLEVHEALVNLRQLSPRQERVVELKFFGGLETREIAEALGISESVVKREWRFARAWLSMRLDGRIE